MLDLEISEGDYQFFSTFENDRILEKVQNAIQLFNARYKDNDGNTQK